MQLIVNSRHWSNFFYVCLHEYEDKNIEEILANVAAIKTEDSDIFFKVGKSVALGLCT